MLTVEDGYFRKNLGHCSATLVGSNTLLTAAHCVLDSKNQFYKRFGIRSVDDIYSVENAVNILIPSDYFDPSSDAKSAVGFKQSNPNLTFKSAKMTAQKLRESANDVALIVFQELALNNSNPSNQIRKITTAKSLIIDLPISLFGYGPNKPPSAANKKVVNAYQTQVKLKVESVCPVSAEITNNNEILKTFYDDYGCELMRSTEKSEDTFAIGEGDSGGPLISSNGQVIGMVSKFIPSSSGKSEFFVGLFSIKKQEFFKKANQCKSINSKIKKLNALGPCSDISGFKIDEN